MAGGQRIQKRLDFESPHLARMALAVKVDVAADPIAVGFCGAFTVVATATHPGDLIHEALGAVQAKNRWDPIFVALLQKAVT